MIVCSCRLRKVILKSRHSDLHKKHINSSFMQPRTKSFGAGITEGSEVWNTSTKTPNERPAFMRIEKLCTNPTMLLAMLRRTYTLILIYRTETWTMDIHTMRRLEGFELWSSRRILKLSLTQHLLNENLTEQKEKLKDAKRNIWTVYTEE